MMHRFELIAVLVLVVSLAACEAPPTFVNASVPDSPRPVASFDLVDQYGEAFSETDLRGHWTLLFSGFTYCPDICPATLGLLKAAQERLDHPPAYRTVFVSVDPERDTSEKLREYLEWFDPDWIGLTGESSQLKALLDSLDMAHVRVPVGNGEYTMDHTTAVVLIDPNGYMAGYWKAPIQVKALAEDLGQLSAR